MFVLWYLTPLLPYYFSYDIDFTFRCSILVCVFFAFDMTNYETMCFMGCFYWILIIKE